MKRRVAAASTDPSELRPFGSQVTNSVNDLSLQLPNCPLPQNPSWACDARQVFAAPVTQISADLPTASKSGGFTTVRDVVPQIVHQGQFPPPKKYNSTGQATSQLAEPFIHSSQLSAPSQQNDVAQLVLEMTKNQLSQQSVNRTIPQKTIPDKLSVTSKSPPLRSPSETVRGFVNGNQFNPQNSFDYSSNLHPPPPPPLPPLSRSQVSRPFMASAYSSASSAFYNPQVRQSIPTEPQTKIHLDKMGQSAFLSFDKQIYSAAQLYILAQQQQQQQLNGYLAPQMSFSPHSEGHKKPLIGNSKVSLPLNTRKSKNDPYNSQLRPPSNDPYDRTAPSCYPWYRTEPSSLSTGSSYSTIDILRESKQASESMIPANKLLTTTGVFYPEKQQNAHPSSSPSAALVTPPLPAASASLRKQSDAVDHHFRMALCKNKGSGDDDNSIKLEPSTPIVDLTSDEKTVDCHKRPRPLPNHSSMTQALHHCVSSCSSSSSISSVSLLDRDANSPATKPFSLLPPKSENRINSETCRFSLKKRLIQRYQADATTELASEFATIEKEKGSDQQLQTALKQEASAVQPENRSRKDPIIMEDTNVSEGPAHESPITPTNESLPDRTPSRGITKHSTSSTTRRQPPVRASKIAPFICFLNQSSLSPSSTSSPTKGARSNVRKRRSSFTTGRKRGAIVSGGGAKRPRGKTTKLRFYNSRISSPAATSDIAPQSSGRSLTSSIRSTNDQAHSEFDFNDLEEKISLADKNGGCTKAAVSQRWFGKRKRKSTAVLSDPPFRVKVPRRSTQEVEGIKRTKHSRRAQNSRQKRITFNPSLKSYSEEEDDDYEKEEGEEYSNENDPEITIQATLGEEGQDPDGSKDYKKASSKEEESLKCLRCGQMVKAVKLEHRVDPFDFQCCEGKLSLQVIGEQFPPSRNLAILSHRSLCGGDLGNEDADSEANVPFLQLNSCTELEQLKPTFRCRACREAIRISSTTAVATNTIPITSDSDNKVDRNGARRRCINNHSPSSIVAPSAKSSTSSTSRGNNKTGNGSKSAAATVSVFCRFWGFRKLYYAQRGFFSVFDFCRTSEADAVDRSLWAMHRHVSPPLSRQNAIYCLDRLGAIACRLILSELSILSSSTSSGLTVIRQCCPPPNSAGKTLNSPSRHVAWKRPVQGVREMCDVCETTMFNSHWVCTKCGYSVCSACYYAKTPSSIKPKDSPDSIGDAVSNVASTTNQIRAKEEGFKGLSPAVAELSFEDYSVRQPWSTCSASRRPHDPNKMMLTALLPFGSLHCLWHRLHRIVPHLDCACLGDSADHRTSIKARARTKDIVSAASSTDTSATTSLDLLADLVLKSTTSSEESLESDGICDTPSVELVHDESRQLNENAGSSGVLYLKEGGATAFKAFQRHWGTNRPVVISGCRKHFNSSLWTPKSLSRENTSAASAAQIVLVDCETNLIAPRYPIRAFWEAFETHPNNSKSMRESAKVPRYLKVRQWPPSEDLAEEYPDRYADFMEHLPLLEYTHREGQLNLAARLPSFFVRPDLGPRLHIAQDLTSNPKIGTMNLRVDVTDVVNIMMHATRSTEPSSPKVGNSQLRAFLRSAGVDPAEIFHSKVHTNSSSSSGLPGAVWHIFRPCDTLALREYLTKADRPQSSNAVCRGAGSRESARSTKNTSAVGAGGDVIHDQQIYLSREQLNSLEIETSIRPYTVLQFPGDAIFIPAGSVHQVRNLANCISASSDFISPEHVPQCLELTEEFRRLPRNHLNHEDKLQVKNIIFHAVKDALSTVLMTGTTTITPTASSSASHS